MLLKYIFGQEEKRDMSYYINLTLGEYKINKKGYYSNIPPFFINTGKVRLKTLNVNCVRLYMNYQSQPILTLKKNIKGSVGRNAEEENWDVINLQNFAEAKEIHRLQFVFYLNTQVIEKFGRLLLSCLSGKKKHRSAYKKIVVTVNNLSCLHKPLEKFDIKKEFG